jgi:hypothetical protein
MAYTIWAVAESSLTITGTSGGSGLDGVTQGDGSHLLGATITWNGGGWDRIEISDNDPNFDDNDGEQRLANSPQDVFGVRYTGRRNIEAEYVIVLEGPGGARYTAIGVNVNQPGPGPSFGTIEGLAFFGPPPPPGVPMRVVETREGPGSQGQPVIPAANYFVPPCFTTGVLIRTADGARPVETLRPGDRVWTADGGMRPLLRLLSRPVSGTELAARPALRPILIRAGALGPGRPLRDLRVSPQHRILVSDWRAALHWGAEEVLVPARALVDGHRVVVDAEATCVTYHHLVFDAHEIVESEGLLSESYLPGAVTLAGLTADEMLAAAAVGAPARPGVAASEGVVLVSRPAETARLG